MIACRVPDAFPLSQGERVAAKQPGEGVKRCDPATVPDRPQSQKPLIASLRDQLLPTGEGVFFVIPALEARTRRMTDQA
jgi:hypothetical protein